METFQYKGSSELEKAFILASGYAGNYPNLPDPDRTSLLFYGGVGTGKTHLAVAIAQGLLERGIGCVFSDYRELLKRIQATFDPTNPATEAGVVAPLLHAEVLILDDLGVGRATDWALETLHYILNHRYSQRLATILTTNLEDLASSIEKREAVLVQAVGERLRSRLYEMCQFAGMHGEDYRQRGLTA
ncbi:MAG: ATP-binding protein, partial [Chloroflexota bacterium]